MTWKAIFGLLLRVLKSSQHKFLMFLSFGPQLGNCFFMIEAYIKGCEKFILDFLIVYIKKSNRYKFV